MIFLRLSSVVMAAFCDKKYVSRRRHVYILRSIFAQPVSYITNRKLFLEKSFSERYLSLSLSSSPVRHWLLFNDAGSKRKFIKLVRLVEFEQYTIFFSFHITYLWASKSGFLYRWLFFADTNRVCKTWWAPSSRNSFEFSRGRDRSRSSSPRIIFLLLPLHSFEFINCNALPHRHFVRCVPGNT